MPKTRVPIHWPKRYRRTHAIEIEIGAIYGLSPSDILILKALSHGLNSDETAEALGFPQESIKTRIPEMQRIFGAKTSAQLIATILREEIID